MGGFLAVPKLVLVIIAMMLPGRALAAGSFVPEMELAPILAEVPVLRDFVENTLELAPSGSAGRVGRLVNPRFGGRRVGPYRILAKPKGVAGPFTFELIFHTDLILLGEGGAAVELPDAHVIRERFKFLEVRPAPTAQEEQPRELPDLSIDPP